MSLMASAISSLSLSIGSESWRIIIAFSQVYNMNIWICLHGDQTPEILSPLAKRHTNFSLAFFGRKRPKILADIFAK